MQLEEYEHTREDRAARSMQQAEDEPVDYVALAVEHCLNEGKTPGSIDWSDDLAEMSPAEQFELAYYGYVVKITRALYEHRGRVANNGNGGKVASGTHPVDGRNPGKRWAALRVSLQGKDGRLKPLMEFTIEDAQHLGTLARKLSDGWMKRADLADRIETLLREQHKARVSDLTATTKDQLTVLAKDAWSTMASGPEV